MVSITNIVDRPHTQGGGASAVQSDIGTTPCPERRPSAFSDVLPAGEIQVDVIQEAGRFPGRWWLVHTRPRQEKVLAASLERLRVPHFLPVARAMRRHAGRRRIVELPLFPGYMFIGGGEEERLTVLRTRRAVNVIAVADQKRLKDELRRVVHVVSSGEPVDLYPAIRVGQWCRVRRGVLAGLEGVVIRRRSVCRVYVAVEILGQSAEVEIDPDLLEAIE